MIESYRQKVKLRNQFLKENEENNFVCITKNSPLLISLPHAVSQIRLGKLKVAEIGSFYVGYILAEELCANLIVKTKNNNDDANFDEVSPYREKIKQLISNCGVRYLLDIHGMKIQVFLYLSSLLMQLYFSSNLFVLRQKIQENYQ